MAHSESKRSSSTRPRIVKFLLLSAACAPIAVQAASHKARNEKALEMERGTLDRGNADPRRRPLLRQEIDPRGDMSSMHAPSSGMVEVSSRGTIGSLRMTSVQHAAALGLVHRSKRHRLDPTVNETLSAEHGDQVVLPEGNHPFSWTCVDYPRDTEADAADPVSTGQYLCAGEVCKETDYPVARDRCCNCNGGAQFRTYEDTQCFSEDGLSGAGVYHSKHLSNPQPFQDVRDCMMTCWSMGENCSGISIINFDSDFAGMCYFRKGTLKYVHDYKGCYNATCQQRREDVGEDLQMTTPNPETETNETDQRLPYCDDDAIFQNLPCTDNMNEALPRTITTTQAPLTQDEVVDNRDCWVKYMWWR